MAGNIYHDGQYLENNPGWHEEDSLWKAEQIAKILRKNAIKPSSICEIGCGAGEVLLELKQQLGAGIEYSGYEISPQAYEICRKKSDLNVQFYLKDLFGENLTFDVVMAIDVIEHVENYYEFLRNLRKKGTHHVFHIPLDLSVQTVFRGTPIQQVRSQVGHIHYFTRETALAALSETGYRVLDWRYTKASLELPGRGWKSNLLRLPRKLFYSVHEDWAVRILGGCSLLILTE